MNLKIICGKTSYIDLPGSAVGVYALDNGTCVLIDSGNRAGYAGLILDAVKQAGLTVQGIINTHAHADHCSGNHRIQTATHCDVYASAQEFWAIDNPTAGLYCLYSAHPLRMLKNRFLMAEPSQVTHILKNNLLLGGEQFKIIDLKGHSIGQIGLVTPDGVLFAGDSLISPGLLDEFPFLYMADIAGQWETLSQLKQLNQKVFLTHGGLLPDLQHAISRNQKLLEDMTECILNMLMSPLTREQIVQEAARNFHLLLNRTQYFLVSSSLSAFLSYLTDRKEIRCFIDDNMLWFCRN
jgi:glyoxylase-like metal-dependent hydrolase (beta-lactamase superfamily II)